MPASWPRRRAVRIPWRQSAEDPGERLAERLVDGGHLLRQVVERAADADHLRRRLPACHVEDRLQGGDRVVTPRQRVEKPVDDLAADRLLEHREAEGVLAAEVVVERPLGDPRLAEDGVEARRAEAAAVDLLASGLEDRLAGAFRILLPGDWGGCRSGVCRFHTDQYVCFVESCQPL